MLRLCILIPIFSRRFPKSDSICTVLFVRTLSIKYLQSFVRANHYGHAFTLRNPLDPGDFLVEDRSALWAEGRFRWKEDDRDDREGATHRSSDQKNG
jgi:hypothetical protein